MISDYLPILQTALYYLVTVVVRLIFRWLHELARLAQCLLELMCRWYRSLGRIEIRPRLSQLERELLAGRRSRSLCVLVGR